MYRIVFSDVDGTLLNSKGQVSERTRYTILLLQKKGIPFVIVSARGPASVYPILNKMGMHCPIIGYCGALIQDENHKVLFNTGFTKEQATELVGFMEESRFDLSRCAYVGDDWYVADKRDPRILREEAATESCSIEGQIDSLPEGTVVNKLLCICAPGTIDVIQAKLKARFPAYTVAKSNEILLEVIPSGIHKATATERLCRLWGLSAEEAIAFGDSENDFEMLSWAGCGVIMGNAPPQLRKAFRYIAPDNDRDGLAVMIEKLVLTTGE